MSPLPSDRLRHPAAVLAGLVDGCGAEEALVRLSFWAGRRFRAHAESVPLQEMMGQLSRLFREFEPERLELTDEAAETIEDTLLSRRTELHRETALLHERAHAALSPLSIPEEEHPTVALFAACSLLHRPESRVPLPRGEKLIAYAFFCGTIE